MTQDDSKNYLNQLTKINRRSFIRWSVFLGLASTLGLRFLVPAKGEEFSQLSLFSQSEARLMSSLLSVITFEKDDSEIEKSIVWMDQFLSTFSRREKTEFKIALKLIEHSPILFHGWINRFTSLNKDQQIKALASWKNGATWRRPVFSAVRDLCFFSHYQKEKNWSAIGYDGPIVPLDRAKNSIDFKYEALLARKS